MQAQQSYRKQEDLLAEFEKHKQAAGAATTDSSQLFSPTGRELDQTATSQLVWNRSNCPDLFPGAATTGTASVDVTPPGVSAAAGSSTGSSCSVNASYTTVQSCFTDLSYISPLRGSSSRLGQEPTPCSLAYAGAGGGCSAGQHSAGHNGAFDSPLSTQSLSMFSNGNGAASPGSIDSLNPRRLQLGTPVLKIKQEAAAGGCNSSSKAESCTHACSDAEHRDQQQKQRQDEPAVGSPQLGMMLMSPVFGIKPQDLQCCAAHSSMSSQPDPTAPAVGGGSAGGLSLEAEFRVAACHSLWPSPALTEASIAAVHGGSQHAGCASHMLWLPHTDNTSSPAPARVLALDFSPMPSRFGGSTRAASASLGVWFAGDECCEQEVEDENEQQQGHQHHSSKRRWLLIGLCVMTPLTIAVAAGGAAAWRFRREEVEEVAAAVKCGVRLAAGQTQCCWKHCQRGASAAWTKAKRLMQWNCGSSIAGTSSAGQVPLSRPPEEPLAG